MRSVTRKERGALTEVKVKEWLSWLDQGAVKLVKSQPNVP